MLVARHPDITGVCPETTRMRPIQGVGAPSSHGRKRSTPCPGCAYFSWPPKGYVWCAAGAPAGSGVEGA